MPGTGRIFIIVPVKARIEGRVLRLTTTGPYTWADLLAAIRRSMAQDGFIDGSRCILLFDSRGSEAARSADELRDIAGDLASLAPDFAAILTVVVDDLRYGLARMLAAYTEHLGAEVLVFRSMDVAESWIRTFTSREPSRG